LVLIHLEFALLKKPGLQAHGCDQIVSLLDEDSEKIFPDQVGMTPRFLMKIFGYGLSTLKNLESVYSQTHYKWIKLF